MQLQKITLTFRSGGLVLFEGRIDIYKFITTKNDWLLEIIHSVRDEHNLDWGNDQKVGNNTKKKRMYKTCAI